MNIRPVKTDAVIQPASSRASKAPEPAKEQIAADSFKAEQKDKLMTALHEQPEVRPEVVERAQRLAADPDYPSAEALEAVAKLFVRDAKK